MNSKLRYLFRPWEIPGRMKRKKNNQKLQEIYENSQKDNTGLYGQIREALNVFHGGGGYNRPFQDYKVYSMLELLNFHKPKESIEFGSGTSTFAFAKYISENAGCCHTVVDESKKWLENTKAAIQHLGFGDDRITWLQSDKVENSDLNATSYKDDFNGCNPDFIFIDGPTLTIGSELSKTITNIDYLKFMEEPLPQVIAVDIRKHTVSKIEQEFGRNYRLTTSNLIDPERTIDGIYNYFSVFELKD